MSPLPPCGRASQTQDIAAAIWLRWHRFWPDYPQSHPGSRAAASSSCPRDQLCNRVQTSADHDLFWNRLEWKLHKSSRRHQKSLINLLALTIFFTVLVTVLNKRGKNDISSYFLLWCIFIFDKCVCVCVRARVRLCVRWQRGVFLLVPETRKPCLKVKTLLKGFRLVMY